LKGPERKGLYLGGRIPSTLRPQELKRKVGGKKGNAGSLGGAPGGEGVVFPKGSKSARGKKVSEKLEGKKSYLK